jgi:uncharacterized protein YecT (DUF1311 family)
MGFRFAATVTTVLLLSIPCRAADRWPPDTDACNQQSTTFAIVACLDASAKLWDRRLNQAYQAVLALSKDDPARTAALKTAQRAWLQYRSANCAFYETTQGTIRLIEVAACNRDMTQARALELQAEGPQ